MVYSPPQLYKKEKLEMGLVSDTFTIISSKQKDVVVGILKINGDTTSDAERTGDMGKPFCGEVNDDSFKIQRVIWYRNSFLPVITGTITAKGEGYPKKRTMTAGTRTLIWDISY
jgi:hypothetical protein